ncbi:MAG TPA: gamma-glutamyltransferase [Thermodesulfobacteriota bacterium]
MADRPLRAPLAAVTAPHELAAAAGQAILARGGTAIDAAIAVAAVLSVVYPHMTGIGGDGFWLIADPADRGPDGAVRVRAIDASGRAAAAVSREAYSARGAIVPWRGPAAALTVPGAVDGWWEAHRHSVERWGSTLAWADLLEPAIRYAERGYPCSASQARWTAVNLDTEDQARKALQRFDEWASTYLVNGRPPQVGEVVTNRALARTLGEIAADGRETFYRGRVAAALCAGLAEVGSPLTAEDFAAHQAEWVEPIRLAWRGLEIFAMPPSTQGVAALQILGILDAAGVADTPDSSADRIHLVAEATRLAFADRDRFVADRDHMPVAVDRLLDPAYLAARASLIDRKRAMVAVKPGLSTTGGVAAGPADGDTVWFGAVDPAGRMASVIQSLYFDFGSGIVPRGTGVLLQNRGAGFRLEPDHPNVLAPRKRPFHTLCPLLVTSGGAPHAVIGTMGGDGQPQTCAMLALRLFVDGLDPRAAVEAPRWLYGRTWGAATLTLALEAELSQTARELRERGHPVEVLGSRVDQMGHAGVIRLDPAGVRLAAADPRSDGAAIGF